MDLTTLQQTVGERLRYREVPEIVGRSVVINALSSIERDITQTMSATLPAQCQLVETCSPVLSIKKLGILTLDFAVSTTVLANNYQTGNELLKKLGYIDNPDAQKAYRIAAIISGAKQTKYRDLMGLTDLLDDLNRGQAYFKLECRVDEMPRRLKAANLRDLMHSLPDDYLPREFRVKRACFTNSKLVWLHTYGIGVSIF